MGKALLIGESKALVLSPGPNLERGLARPVKTDGIASIPLRELLGSQKLKAESHRPEPLAHLARSHRSLRIQES